MRIGVAFLAVCAAFGCGAGLACETIAFPPVRPSEWTVGFSGIVKEHISQEIPFDSPITAPGLLVEVEHPLLRVHADDALRVFPLGTGLGCELVARAAADVRREYPVGTPVTVVGWTLETAPDVILTSADGFGHVARVPRDAPTTRLGYLDFRSYRTSVRSQPADGFSSEIAWANANHQWYEDYAFLQCLVALQSELPRADRLSILENVAYYFRYHLFGGKIGEGFYRELLKSQKVSRRDRKRLRGTFRQAEEQANNALKLTVRPVTALACARPAPGRPAA